MAKRPSILAPQLRKLVKKHAGNLSAIARELSESGHEITRQGLSLAMKRYGLLEQAERARARSGIPGPRAGLRYGVIDPKEERQRIRSALRQAPSLEAAAARLKMSRRQLARKRDAYGLSA